MVRPFFIICGAFCAFLFQIQATQAASESSTLQARTLFDRLTGVRLLATDPRLSQMADLIDAGKLREAAHIATDDDRFYNVVVRDFATVMSNREQDPLGELNDFITFVVGVTRDDLDARLFLSGNFTYRGKDELNLPLVSTKNNDHFLALDSGNFNLRKNLIQVKPQWPGLPEAAGLLSTRGWAKAHYDMGTNRRALALSFEEFLCRKLPSLKDFSAPDGWVRRDIDRAPSGKPKDYQTDCRGCHGGMDGLGGAFAQWDFKNGALRYFFSPQIAPKYNQHPEVYPEGYVTQDSSWVNYWTKNQNESIGWHGKLEGVGLPSYGEMLSNTDAFASCMSTRAFKRVCKKEPSGAEQAELQSIAQEFSKTGYSMRRLFENVALSSGCMDRGIDQKRLRNHRELYEAILMAARLDESPLRKTIDPEYRNFRSRLPKYGYPSELTATTMKASSDLAAAVCGVLMRTELESAGTSWVLPKSKSVILANQLEATSYDLIARELIQGLWAREPQPKEKEILRNLIQVSINTEGGPKANAQKSLTAGCTLILSSLETLLN